MTFLASTSAGTGASVIPLKFSLTSFSRADTYRAEQFKNCEAARAESHKLTERLFNEQVVLKNALEKLELHLQPVQVACFDVEGKFDHAVCLLRLNQLGPSHLFIQTRFYKDKRLVCTTHQHGLLAFKDETCS